MKLHASALVAGLILTGSTCAAGVYSFDVAPSLGNAGLANSYAADGTTFAFAVFAPLVDNLGSDIPGTDRWQIDTGAGAVTVEKPADYGRSATSETALNALFQPVFVLFPPSATVTGFSGKLEKSPIAGNANPVQSILFFNSQDQQIGSLAVDLSVSSGTFNITGLSGVTKALLPAGKFYQQVGFTGTQTVVPEIDARSLVAGGLLLGVMALRRQRR